jgi:hypothetical protein
MGWVAGCCWSRLAARPGLPPEGVLEDGCEYC